MDFRYSGDCCDFLKEKCFKVLIDGMKLLNFENLYERVIELEGKILIKYFLMYEF